MNVLSHFALFALVCSLFALNVAVFSIHFSDNILHYPKYLNAKNAMLFIEILNVLRNKALKRKFIDDKIFC